jgi:hypothetical protein
MLAQLRDYKRAIADEGMSLVSIDRTKRHYRLTVRCGDKQFMVIASVSPSDHRVMHNFRKTLKHQLSNTIGVDKSGQHALASIAIK